MSIINERKTSNSPKATPNDIERLRPAAFAPTVRFSHRPTGAGRSGGHSEGVRRSIGDVSSAYDGDASALRVGVVNPPKRREFVAESGERHIHHLLDDGRFPSSGRGRPTSVGSLQTATTTSARRNCIFAIVEKFKNGGAPER